MVKESYQFVRLVVKEITKFKFVEYEFQWIKGKQVGTSLGDITMNLSALVAPDDNWRSSALTYILA